jgi:hypothetical protein
VINFVIPMAMVGDAKACVRSLDASAQVTARQAVKRHAAAYPNERVVTWLNAATYHGHGWTGELAMTKTWRKIS